MFLQKGTQYLIPPAAVYFVDNIINLPNKLAGCTFDLILMDPPWENKHVKRTSKRRRFEEETSSVSGGSNSSYQYLSNEAIGQQLPIDTLLSKANGLLVIYCTNSQRHQKAIQGWLQNWGLVNITKWYWLKVR